MHGVIQVKAYCIEKFDFIADQDDGSYIKVIVQDDGIGMTPDQVDKIFEPFSQSSINKRGNGVGLSICKKICEQMDGMI